VLEKGDPALIVGLSASLGVENGISEFEEIVLFGGDLGVELEEVGILEVRGDKEIHFNKRYKMSCKELHGKIIYIHLKQKKKARKYNVNMITDS
jgi:hypothetical protein